METPLLISSSELKPRFSAFGHFYSVQLRSGERLNCRSVLELVASSHVPTECQDLARRVPNALFILMNPGSSEPMNGAFEQIQLKTLRRMSCSLVPAKPDPTLYQLMRVMRSMNWRHVRVLNLSDLCSSKSDDFLAQFSRLERDERFDSHSVFCGGRTAELASKLPRRSTTPLVLAWGLKPRLEPLIRQCLAKLPAKTAFKGVLEPGSTHRYRHPAPRKREDKLTWLTNVVRRLEE